MSRRAGNEDGPVPRSRVGSGRRDGSVEDSVPDLGDLIVVLLAGSLAGLRDRLHLDGYHEAADLMADLVEATDDYLVGRTPSPPDVASETGQEVK